METASLGTEKVRWNLTTLYTDVDDPTLNADLGRFGELAQKFQVQYKGQLREKLGTAIADYAELDMLSNKVMAYLSLKQSLDVTETRTKAKIAEAERLLSSAAGEYLTFFELEIIELDDAELASLYAANAVVAKHRPWLEHIRVYKPHVLTEAVESALTKRSPFMAGTWSEFFEEVESDLAFDFHEEKKTLTEMLHALTASKDGEERATALRLINEGFRGHFAKYAAQTLYVVSGLKSIEDKERKYTNPMTARNISNRIPDEVVSTLHQTVMEVAGPLAQRYYRLKAKHLGLERLRWSDRNAPMPFADGSHIPFEEAKKIVEEAYTNFSPTLANIVEQFFQEERVDAPAGKGKQSGAFNLSIVLSGGKPASFTLLNYLGSNNDVMTLAHELGHGVHGILAGEAQGPLMYHAPIAYCETASVFGEMTTYNFLKERLTRVGDLDSLLALTMEKIDGMMNTVVRQIGFSNFERRLHGMDPTYTTWSVPRKLSDDELNGHWLATVQELYGHEGDVFTYKDTEYLWSYVSHFHRPFYVYGYAFGELLTQGLYAERGRLGERFEPLYLDLLRSGSTKDVVELLKPFDLDPKSPTFWAEGIKNSLGALVAEAEKLSTEKLK